MVINVLFVDADPQEIHHLQQLTHALKSRWHCLFATSAEEAQAQLAKNPCDIIVVDLNMAQGTKLLAMVEQKYPKMLRFAFTDPANPVDLVRSGILAHQYLPKTASLPVMQEAVESALLLRASLTGDTLKTIISRIRKLPGLPAIYLEITKELNSRDPSVNRIGQLIAKDSGLYAQVLKLVNSAAYGLRYHISSPTHAASLLGLETLQSLVLYADIFEQYDRIARMVPNFSMEAYQRHCLATSRYSADMARSEGWNSAQCNSAAMAGLLHDTGKLILAENFPQQYAQVLNEAQIKGIAVWQAEKTIIGTTHAEIGAYLLGLWGITGAVVQACAFHHQPQYCTKSGVSLTGLLHMADAFDAEPDLAKLDAVRGRIDRAYLQSHALESKLPAWQTVCRIETTKKASVIVHPLDEAPVRPVSAPAPAAPAGFWPRLVATVRGWFV